MVVRAIALTIALLIGIGAIIPLATELAEAGPKKSKRYKKKRGWKGVKKYSKRWWQLYRAQERRKKRLANRRRALRLRQLRLAKVNKSTNPKPQSTAARPTATPDERSPALLPTGDPAPLSWKRGQVTGSELQFSVDGGNGTAAISVVGPAMGESVDTGRNRAVGGVSTTSLRREVINRMIRENGWVVNDYQKEIGGKPVYVVVAQSQGNGGRVNSRMFYFTEANGRIYSVSTNSHTEAADRIAEESEKVIFSLQARSKPLQAGVRE